MTLPAFADTNGTSSQTNDTTQPFWVPYAELGTSIGTLALIATFSIQYLLDRKIAIQDNFIKILDIIGSEEVRKCRRLLVKYRTTLQRLSNNPNFNQLLYDSLTSNDKSNPLLQPWEVEILNAYDQVALTYDRLAFLLLHDRNLYKKIMDYHSFAISQQWNIIGEFLTELQTDPRKNFGMYYTKLVNQMKEKKKFNNDS